MQYVYTILIILNESAFVQYHNNLIRDLCNKSNCNVKSMFSLKILICSDIIINHNKPHESIRIPYRFIKMTNGKPVVSAKKRSDPFPFAPVFELLLAAHSKKREGAILYVKLYHWLVGVAFPCAADIQRYAHRNSNGSRWLCRLLVHEGADNGILGRIDGGSRLYGEYPVRYG